eukprot:m.404739 g.404739  ORF g.404739 m.404739 type:complete len:592 (-) comp28421_c0_seq4:3606-5381(-)
MDPSAAGLPPGWGLRDAPGGKTYFADSIRQSTQWVHPVTSALPLGWHIQFDHRCQPYYTNEADGTTQWEHPAIGNAAAVAASGAVDASAVDRLAAFLADGTVSNVDGKWVPAAPNAKPAPTTAWEVLLDGGVWFKFDRAGNAKVAAAIATGVEEVGTGTNRTVNWVNGTQTRTDTGMVRPVRPVRSAAPQHQHAAAPTAPAGGQGQGQQGAPAAAAAAAPPSGLITVWEVMTDTGWVEYSEAHTRSLEAGFNDAATDTLTLTVATRMGSTEYVIDLRARTQVRKLKQGAVREIRRTVCPGPAPSAGAQPLKWEVETDAGWVGYSAEHSAEITSGLRAGKNAVRITITTGTGRTQYTVTLDRKGCSQTRTDGNGKPRAVRPAKCRPPGDPWEVETDTGWAGYTAEACAVITEAVKAQKKAVHIVINTQSGPTAYVIDLDPPGQRCQRRTDGYGTSRAVRNAAVAVVGAADADAAPTGAAPANAAPADGPGGDGDGHELSSPTPSCPMLAPPRPRSPSPPPPIPQDLLCPITMMLLKNPVVAADGFTYERAIIEEWLETHDTSPITNATLDHKQLVPNNTIKALISSEGYTDG